MEHDNIGLPFLRMSLVAQGHSKGIQDTVPDNKRLIMQTSAVIRSSRISVFGHRGVKRWS